MRAALFAALFGLAAPLAAGVALAASPPSQPAAGPGGADYVVPAGEIEKRSFGEGNGRALAFWPRAAAEKPRPVIVFLHAPGAISPAYYGAWLSHLARRGNVVIYPLYEAAVGAVPFDEMTGEALKGLSAALAGIAADPSARADLSRLVFAGHSGGAVIAANLAARSGRDGLPPARLLFGVMPARPGGEKIHAPPLEDLSGLPAEALAVMFTGDRDQFAGDRGARQILAAAAHLGQNGRLIARGPSDSHGQPAVSFTHYAAVAPDEAWDLAAMPGGAEQAPAPGPETKTEKGARRAAPAPREEARRQREEQRRRAAALWRVGHEERMLLANFEGRSVGAASYAIWKTFDLALEAALSGGDALTLRRDPRFYDIGQWSDGWPLRRMGVETPRPPASATAGVAAPDAATSAR